MLKLSALILYLAAAGAFAPAPADHNALMIIKGGGISTLEAQCRAPVAQATNNFTNVLSTLASELKRKQEELDATRNTVHVAVLHMRRLNTTNATLITSLSMQMREARIKSVKEQDIRDALSCGLDFNCWKSKIEFYANKIDNYVAELRTMTLNFNTMMKVFNKMLPCINTLPGAMPPLALMGQIGHALDTDSLLPWISKTYIKTFMDRASIDMPKGMTIVQQGFKHITGSLVQANGQLNISALATIPPQLLAVMKQVLSIDPTGQCIANSGIFDHMGKLEQPLNELLVLAGHAVTDLWNELTKPGSLLSHAINWIVSAAQEAMANFLPSYQKLDETVGHAISSISKMATTTLTGYLNAVTGHLPPGFCGNASKAVAQSVTNPAMALQTVFTYLLSWAATELTEWVTTHVWKPLLADVQRLLGQAYSALMQGVDGLCGLIPEVGGAICAAITIPVNWVFKEISDVITSRGVQGFIGLVNGYVQTQIPAWSKSAADAIVSAFDSLGNAMKNAVPPEILSFATQATSVMSSIETLLTPIFELVKPYIEKIIGMIFPKVQSAIADAQADVGIIVELVQYKICPAQGSCASSEDSWPTRPGDGNCWHSVASLCCYEWATNKDWGALQNGGTVQDACNGDWAKGNCGRFCCDVGQAAKKSDMKHEMKMLQ